MNKNVGDYAKQDALHTKRVWECAPYYVMPDIHFHQFGTRGIGAESILAPLRKGPSYAQLLLMAGDSYPEVATAINTTVSESEETFDYDAYNSRTIYNR